MAESGLEISTFQHLSSLLTGWISAPSNDSANDYCLPLSTRLFLMNGLLFHLSKTIWCYTEHLLEAADELPRITIADLFADVIEFPLSCFQQLCCFSEFEIFDSFREGPSGLLLKHAAQIGFIVMEFCSQVMERNGAVMIVHIVDHVEYSLVP